MNWRHKGPQLVEIAISRPTDQLEEDPHNESLPHRESHNLLRDTTAGPAAQNHPQKKAQPLAQGLRERISTALCKGPSILTKARKLTLNNLRETDRSDFRNPVQAWKGHFLPDSARPLDQICAHDGAKHGEIVR